jgi:alkylhydroperoxidase family enzyme
MRKGLAESQARAWAAIAAPGTWLTGEQRVAVAAEVRHARSCPLCAKLKEALSPNVPGEHASLGKLGAADVELVHRVVSDPGRLTESWTQSIVAQGLSEGEYVEIVGIIAMVMMIDTFHRALGLPEPALPAPKAGAPTRYTPPGAKKQAAWLALVEPEDAVPADGPLYPHPRVGYIYRALSLVPQAVRDYWALAFEHYLPSEFVYKFDQSIRAISRPQTEVIAARVSALHQCAY